MSNRNEKTGPPDTESPATTESLPDVISVADCSEFDWWPVHLYVAPVLARVKSWPIAGTPEWCALDDDDPAKMAAVFDAAQQRALDVDTRLMEALQTYDEWLARQRLIAECDASRAISAAEDWTAVANYLRDEREFYTEKPWMRRTAS
jgi:hypothetical protein